MNTIKFRLRDENKKIIGYEYFTQGEDLSGHWHYDFSMNGVKEWFQTFKWITKIRYRDMFTELKDINNQEIFERDVVHVNKYYIGDSLVESNIGRVKYGNGSFFIDYEFAPELCKEEILNEKIKIIGDIFYNNPELLKEKNGYSS